MSVLSPIMIILPSVNPKMRNIAGKKSSLSEVLLSALASKTAIRLKVRLCWSMESEVLQVLFTKGKLLFSLQLDIQYGKLKCQLI